MSLTLPWSHTFVEFDHEILSSIIFLLPLTQEGLWQLQAKVCARSIGYTLSQAWPGKVQLV